MIDAPSPTDIAIVIVNWNSWRLSLACLESLRASVGARWHLYLVDNASSDGSLDHLTNLGSDVTLLASDVNGGWTGGNNLAIRRALENGYDYVFILNNDAMVEPETLIQLLRFHRAHGLNPILGPIHLDHDGITPEFVGATMNPLTGLADITNISSLRIDALPEFYQTAFIKGAGIFTTRAHFEQIGLFDEDFYLNYDDTDWAFRARELRFELLMLPAARIIHGGSGSIGGGYSPLNIYFLTRNQLLFAERHCRLAQRPRQMMEMIRQGNRLIPSSFRLGRTFLLVFGKTTLARAWRAGVRDYVLRRFGDCPKAIREMRT